MFSIFGDRAFNAATIYSIYAHLMDQMDPRLGLEKRFLLARAPHAGRDDPGNAVFCPQGVTKVRAAVGAICKYFSRMIGQSAQSRLKQVKGAALIIEPQCQRPVQGRPTSKQRVSAVLQLIPRRRP